MHWAPECIPRVPLDHVNTHVSVVVRLPSKVKMPKRCVAANCSNTIADGVSLFRFPRDAARRRQWVLQVKRTRARWDFPAVYNASCVLCSDHFEADCFDSSSSVKLSVGYDLQHKRVLLDTAVPTIFARTVTLKQAQHK